MEPIFECTTVHTKPLLRQTAARIMRTKLIIHAVICTAIGLGYMLYILLSQQFNYLFFAAVFGLACIGLAIYRFQSVPKQYAEKTYADCLKLYREPSRTTARVYSEQVSSENLQGTLRYFPLNECRLLETADLFLLLTEKKKSVILLDKAGFTLGTPEEFRAFFRKRAN